jgi:transposase
MIVLGADTHKRNHTLVAVDGQTGALRGQRAIAASEEGSLDALRFAAGLEDVERVWAVEDCRHVSARLEAALIAAGERVIRVAAAMTGQARKVSRQAGKSDPIDAPAVALAVLRDGIESFPMAFTDQHAWEIRVLCDYRDQIICERTRMINRLRWHPVTIAPELEAQLGPTSLRGPQICARLTRQLARLAPSPQLRIARRLLKRISEIVREERELFSELTSLIDAHCPQLLARHGCGPVTAAIIIGHTAGAKRVPTDGHFARHAGTAPVPASSGKIQRHRLHRGGDRQLNRALHIHRALPRQHRPRNARLPGAQTRRGQDQARSDPLPQTPPCAPHLAPALRRRDRAQPLRIDQSLKPGNTDFHLTQEQRTRSCRNGARHGPLGGDALVSWLGVQRSLDRHSTTASSGPEDESDHPKRLCWIRSARSTADSVWWAIDRGRTRPERQREVDVSSAHHDRDRWPVRRLTRSAPNTPHAANARSPAARHQLIRRRGRGRDFWS